MEVKKIAPKIRESIGSTPASQPSTGFPEEIYNIVNDPDAHNPSHSPGSVVDKTEYDAPFKKPEKNLKDILDPKSPLSALLTDPESARTDNTPYNDHFLNSPLYSLLEDLQPEKRTYNCLKDYLNLKKAVKNGELEITSEIVLIDGTAYEKITYRQEKDGTVRSPATMMPLNEVYKKKFLNPDKRVTYTDEITGREIEILPEDVASMNVTEEETDSLLECSSKSALYLFEKDFERYLSQLQKNETTLSPIDYLGATYGLTKEEINKLVPSGEKTALYNHIAGARRSIAGPDPRSSERKRKDKPAAHMSTLRKVAVAGKKAIPIGAAGAVTYLALTLPAAAVEDPDWDKTFIYDLWDNDPPSEAGTYGVHSIVPIVIKGYDDESVELKIVDLEGNVVCQGVSVCNGNYERIFHCPQRITEAGKYKILFAEDDPHNPPIDYFKLDGGQPPIPEAPTWLLTAAGVLTLLGYREYSKRKKKNSE